MKINKELNNRTRSFKSGQIPDQLNCETKIEPINATWFEPVTLLRLDCTTLILSKTRLRIRDLMAFLRRWQQSTDNEIKIIKYWQIDFPFDSSSLDFEELQGTPCDVVKRPEYSGLNAIDIRRHSDGLKATVRMFTDKCLIFEVWHK